MREKLAIAASLALVLTLTSGCRAEPPQEELGDVRIGVTVYRGDDTYISNMVAALQAEAGEYSQDTGTRVTVTVSDAQESQTTQNDQIDRFISLGYDVLCVNLVDRTDAARVIDKAQSADLPIIFFNREPVQEDLMAWSKAYYVGSDARQSAGLQADIVQDLWISDRAALDKNGDDVLQYVMLEGETRHQDTIIRTDVPIQKLKAAGISLERLDGGLANWDRNQAAALSEGYFKTHGEAIELVFCNNDDMALGVVDAAEQLGLGFHNIVGIDGTPQGQAAVAAGQMLGTVVMDYVTHGQTILKMALALALGQDVTDAVQVGEDRSVRVPMYALRLGDGD